MNTRKTILIAYFLSGAAALTYEVAYTRGLILVVGTSSYAYSIMLTAFLSGMGFGSLLAKKYIDKVDPMRFFAYLELGIGAYGLLFIPIINRLDTIYYIIHTVASRSFLLFNILLVLMSYLILLIPTMLMGMTFPVVSKIIVNLDSIGSDIGKLFSVNTLGGVVGAFSAGFIVLPTIGLERTILFAAAVNLIISLCIFLLSIKTLKRVVVYAAIFAGLMLFVLFSINTSVDSYRTGIYYNINEYEDLDSYREGEKNERAEAEILFSDYGLYGSVIVRESRGNKYLILNGKTDASTGMDVPTELLMGYIPMMVHKDPRVAGIIGLGSGLTLSSVLNFDIEEVDMWEINPTVVRACEFFKEDNRNALDDERVHLILADARNYLFTAHKKYDLIISEPSNPWIEGEGSLFTREFYEIIKNRLADDGLFTQWVGAYDFEPEDFKILLRTIAYVFPYYQVWSNQTGTDIVILGAHKEIVFDYIRIKAYFEDKNIQSDFKAIASFSRREGLFEHDLYFSFFVADNKILENYIEGSLLNTDNKPVIEFRTASNRIRGTHNVLLDLLQYMGKGSNTVKIEPDIKNTIDEKKNYIDFLEIEMDRTGMELRDTHYYYQYAYPGQKQGVVDLRLELKKWAVFDYEETQLHIHAQPQIAETPKQEIERIAELFKAEIVRVISKNGRTRYAIKGDGILGMLWYCSDKHYLYIAYFKLPENAVADQGKMECLLSAIECR